MQILKYCAIFIVFGALNALSAGFFEKKSEVRYEVDLKPQEEVLDDVKKTQEIFQMKAQGIKPPKTPRDPRNKFFVGVSVASVYASSYDLGYQIGAQAGYNFLVQKNNSFRIYAFFDRYTNGVDDHFNFDRARANAYQMYRIGISAEYRAYVNKFFGTKLRLVGVGVKDIASTTDELIPEFKSRRTTGILPLIAGGLIFSYKVSEIFVGLDFLDYQAKGGAIVNFLEYGVRF